MRVITRAELYGAEVNWLVNAGSEKMRSSTLSIGTRSRGVRGEMVMVVVTTTSPPTIVELGSGLGLATCIASTSRGLMSVSETTTATVNAILSNPLAVRIPANLPMAQSPFSDSGKHQ